MHDYLTQRGGAERVVLSILSAFPDATIYTSLYDPDGTFPEFRATRIQTLGIDRIPLLRRHHRLALPLLSVAFSRLRPEADLVLCSSSGWAHGVQTTGRKIVYCHAPARWLYARDYLGRGRPAARFALSLLRRRLLAWDRNAAASAHRYLTNSNANRDRIRARYGIDAEVVPPPPRIDPTHPRRAVSGIEEGFSLCVSRLHPYKHVDAVVAAASLLPAERFVLVGTGPEEKRLRAQAGPNVRFVGAVADEELCWLYSNCSCVVAASHEDYGLTPLEGAVFGKPSVALRIGGYLDTVDERKTGVFFDRPEPRAIADALRNLSSMSWEGSTIQAHARSYSEERFIARLRDIALEEAQRVR